MVAFTEQLAYQNAQHGIRANVILPGEKELLTGHLAERHRDVAVVRAEAGHCGACRQQIPPQMAVEVRKNDQLITCPACGRILVHYED